MWASTMSTADFAKLAFGGPDGPHEEALQRILNELLRSPACGIGPGANLAGPGLGGIGLSPGALTTSAPLRAEPTATLTALPQPSSPPEAATAHIAQSVLPQPSYGGPSVGGAGASPGAVSTAVPKHEPTASQSAVDPLDALAAAALAGPAYAGPSLAGIGRNPGMSASALPAGVGVPNGFSTTEAPLAAPTPPKVEPLGPGIPGEAELRSLLAPALLARFAYGDQTTSFGLSDAPPAAPAGVQVPATSHAVRSLTGPSTPEFQSAHPEFDVNQIRRDFPILAERVNGRPLIWLDNAATTQKPRAVIDRVSHFYEHENSNIHRGAHELAARSTDAYEAARDKVARFLGAASSEEIVFVRGATEAINLVAASWGGQNIGEGDEIVITHLEHHANIVPWQQLALAKGANLRVAPVDDSGQILLDEYAKLLGPKTRIVAFPQVSNALGTITPAKAIIDMAHRVGARVLLDGAQSVSHMPVNVQSLDADFFVLSGHKLFAPTGIGVLHGKKELLDSMPPWQTGGNMITDVTFERTQFHGAPQRFEAGTGNIADAVGLGAAIDYIERIGLANIERYEHDLIAYATKLLREIPGLTIIGTAPEKAGVISFILKGIASEEVGARLNKYGIAVRSGHHCAQPILRRFGLEATVRPSFAFYNTCGEIDALAAAITDIQSETGLTRL